MPKVVPYDASEVTEEWMCSTLTGALDGAASAKRTWVYEAKHQESGMLSSIFRAKLDVTYTDGTVKEHKVFIKIMPSDDVHKGLILNQAMDVTEVKSYETFFPDLVKFEKEQDSSISESGNIMSMVPRMFSAGCDMSAERRSFYVMLEDLSPQYEMKDFDVGLTLPQLLNSMRALARYHATCYSYGKVRNVDFRSKYGEFFNMFFECFETDKELAEFMEGNMDLVEADMRESEVEDLLPHVKRLRKGIGKKFGNIIRGSQNETKEFVMHGDIWANNILFDSNDACKIVDWQFTTVGTIFLDFGTTAWISMSSTDTAANEDKIIAAYFDSFKKSCERMMCEELPWNNGDFKEFARRARADWFLLTFLWCSTSYELVHKYPALKERVHWVLRQSVKYNPEAFQ